MNKMKIKLNKLKNTHNIIKKKIFHNNAICCVDEHFPIHLKKPVLETRWKLVFKNKIYSVMEKLDLSVIFIA